MYELKTRGGCWGYFCFPICCSRWTQYREQIRAHDLINRSTVLRAIKAGKISASKDEQGSGASSQPRTPARPRPANSSSPRAAILPPGLSRKTSRIRLSDVNLEIPGFENELVDVNGIEVFQIFSAFFHPIFKCFLRKEPTMR